MAHNHVYMIDITVSAKKERKQTQTNATTPPLHHGPTVITLAPSHHFPNSGLRPPPFMVSTAMIKTLLLHTRAICMARAWH